MINKMHGGMYLQCGLCFVNPSLVLELEMSYGNHQCRKLTVIFLVKIILWYLVCHWRGWRVRWFHILIIALWLRYNLDVATLLGNPTIKCLIGLNVVPCLGLLLLSQIGRAHVWTPVTCQNLVCRLLLEKKKISIILLVHLSLHTWSI